MLENLKIKRQKTMNASENKKVECKKDEGGIS